MERMKRLSEEKSESYQITQEELSKRFETVETQSAELTAAPQRSSSVLDSDIGLFIDDPTFIYQDFAKVSSLRTFLFFNNRVARTHYSDRSLYSNRVYPLALTTCEIVLLSTSCLRFSVFLCTPIVCVMD